MNRLADTFVLSNGRGIPCIGLGTWQTASGEEAVEAVSCAIKMGYRHIDGAAIYGNERSVGKGVALGIREAGISREELFVTSKLWNTERGYDRTLDAFEKTLADLGLDYLDLYLIHWPAAAHQFDVCLHKTGMKLKLVNHWSNVSGHQRLKMMPQEVRDPD